MKVTNRVHISKDDTATFVCPMCSRTRTVNVREHAGAHRAITVKLSCRCGCSWESLLEKRRQYRLPVDLPGTYTYKGTNGLFDSGDMRVVDLSRGGIKLKLEKQRELDENVYLLGDPLEVAFQLEGEKPRSIRKKAFITHLNRHYMGAVFEASQQNDPAIGSYLLGRRHYQLQPSSHSTFS